VTTKLTPAEFSREAGRVIHSPYWTTRPKTDDVEVVIAFRQQREREMATLKAALNTAASYDDLPPAAKAIYNKAKAAMPKGG